MSVKGVMYASIPALILILSLITFTGVYAESEGRFAEYTFSLEKVGSDASKVIDGGVRIEVVSDYGNGTVRVRYEGYIGGTTFTIERNTHSIHIFPYIPRLPEALLPYRNLTVAIKDKGVENVSVDGEEHLVNVTEVAVAGEILHKARSLNLDVVGRIKTFRSSLLYSFAGQGWVNSSSSNLRLSVSIQLKSTNLDVDSEPPESMKIPLGLASHFITSPTAEDREVAESGGGESTSTLLAIPAVAAGVVGSILYLKRRNGRRPAQEAGEKPLHWVH